MCVWCVVYVYVCGVCVCGVCICVVYVCVVCVWCVCVCMCEWCVYCMCICVNCMGLDLLKVMECFVQHVQKRLSMGLIELS